ncbi:MAG: hypothetical protein ABEJ40_07360 [Haloarculaceae archaeon]
MHLSGDELAGVVDLFGGLTRAELDRAVEELAFKRGASHDADALDDAVGAALDGYRLVAVDGRDPPVLVPGPAAFPSLPEGATDLPHIMDVPERDVDRETAAAAALARLADDAEDAAAAGDGERADALLDVSYDLEAWGPVDAGDVRDRLDDV